MFIMFLIGRVSTFYQEIHIQQLYMDSQLSLKWGFPDVDHYVGLRPTIAPHNGSVF